MFDAFDAPDTQSACPRRAGSTHALQALVMLNGDFAVGRARALAARLAREAETQDERIARAYALVLSRTPRPEELARARAFLSRQAARFQEGRGLEQSKIDAWVDFALAMLNRNEFLYIP